MTEPTDPHGRPEERPELPAPPPRPGPPPPSDDAWIAAMLAGLPDPPVPPDLTDRLTDTLAGLRAVPAAPEPTPLRARSHPARARTAGWLAVAAGVALLVAVAVPLLGSRGGASTADRLTTGTAAGGYAAAAPATVPVAYTQSGTHYTAAGLPTQTRALLSGRLPSATPTWGAAAGADATRAPEAGVAPATAPTLLASSAPVPGAGGPATAVTPATAAELAACLRTLATDPGTAPLAVDAGDFAGQPALVVVYATHDQPAYADVWVVGMHCTGTDAHLLHFARVPR